MGVYISIHALLAESDGIFGPRTCKGKSFLSTLSLRRATAFGGLQAALSGDFYPRSPCGERHRQRERHPHALDFYPRSPCGERRPATRPAQNLLNFYPRSPCGERLFRVAVFKHPVVISIHALLAESDGKLLPAGILKEIFLSTLSLRRATPC